jgi:predicted hydrocarbon binding protein
MVNSEEAVIVNALVRQALVSAQEVMGENGLSAVLRSVGWERFINNFPPNDTNPGIRTVEYARFNEAIEAFYGCGGKGMLRRIGKASFQYGVREQGVLMGVAGMALMLLPQKRRIKFVLNAMGNALKKTNPQVNTWLEDEGDKIAYCESTCVICLGYHSGQPVCPLYIGSVTEAVRRATEQEYEIIETHCIAKGDKYCRFEVGEIKT